MTEFYQRMLNKDDDETPEKCRERRRRRIEMRRMAAVSVSGSPPAENRTESEDCVSEAKRFRTAEAADAHPAGEDAEAVPSPSGVPIATPADDRLPVFGSMSVSGRSRVMEDAVSVRTSLYRPECCRRRPVHFFAVYDGHGGPHVALLCREKMHVYLEEELARVESTGQSASGGGGGNTKHQEQQQQRQSVIAEEEGEEVWRKVLKRSFERMDELALTSCACGSVENKCGCHPMEAAFSGSTAVVALLTPDHIVVANCGDSRAILCRSGRAIPLSHDQKPDRSDELARIKASGGCVIFMDGPRVGGILAMSRAIGDRYLKPAVTSEPEISFTKRDPEDECLILASDGLWDVLSNELACKLASECLRDGGPASSAVDSDAGPRREDGGAGEFYPSQSALAAALLTRLALGRKSSDNISVIVVDLKRS